GPAAGPAGIPAFGLIQRVLYGQQCCGSQSRGPIGALSTALSVQDTTENPHVFRPDLFNNIAIQQQDVFKTPFNFAHGIRPWKLKSNAPAGLVTNSTSNPSTIKCPVRSVVR